MYATTWGLLVATFVAALVEFVEALTIVLAIGISRGWRSAWAGTIAALLALAGFTLVAGYTLSNWLPEAALQLAIGSLLLVFGMQWLRKAVLRSSGLLAQRDESAVYARQAGAARDAAHGPARLGVDPFGFAVAFKGVFLEGVEVVFIVVTLGLSAGNLPVAVLAALGAAVVVLALGATLRRPLAAIPENTLKYGVGLLLTTFGTYWAFAGLAVFSPGEDELTWPGGDWAILVLFAVWLAASRVLVATLPRLAVGGGRG